jgi:hypothetical protein
VERGFEVEVFERQVIPGGKSRSIPVPGSGIGGRADLLGDWSASRGGISAAPPCRIWSMGMPPIFAPWRFCDQWRFERGEPWKGELIP